MRVRRKELEHRKSILKIVIVNACAHGEARLDKEHADTADAPDEDVAREEADDDAEAEVA